MFSFSSAFREFRFRSWPVRFEFEVEVSEFLFSLIPRNSSSLLDSESEPRSIIFNWFEGINAFGAECIDILDIEYNEREKSVTTPYSRKIIDAGDGIMGLKPCIVVCKELDKF